MTKFITLLKVMPLLLLATACGKKAVLDVGEFAPYVSQFEDHSAEHGSPVKVTNLVIKYGDMQNSLERGACEIVEDETPTIVIRKDTWDKMNEDEREELLYHELGHCVLHRNHNKEVTPEGLPTSIMNPYIIRGEIYRENQKYYLTELFNQR